MKIIIRKKNCFLILLAMILTFNLQGQENETISPNKIRKNSINILLGYHIQRSQDLVYSPMIYKGASASAIELSYERFTHHGFHRIGFSIDNINVTSTKLISSHIFGNEGKRKESEASQINIFYGYAHSLKSENKLKFLFGGILEAKFLGTDYYFGLSDETGYLLTNSIHPWLLSEYQLNVKNKIKAEIYFPILSWASRPDYSIVDNHSIQYDGSDVSYIYEKGQFVSLNKYYAVDFSIAIVRQLNASTNLLVRYQFNYTRFNEPEQITVLKNNFDIGFSFNF